MESEEKTQKMEQHTITFCTNQNMTINSVEIINSRLGGTMVNYISMFLNVIVPTCVQKSR